MKQNFFIKIKNFVLKIVDKTKYIIVTFIRPAIEFFNLIKAAATLVAAGDYEGALLMIPGEWANKALKEYCAACKAILKLIVHGDNYNEIVRLSILYFGRLKRADWGRLLFDAATYAIARLMGKNKAEVEGLTQETYDKYYSVAA